MNLMKLVWVLWNLALKVLPLFFFGSDINDLEYSSSSSCILIFLHDDLNLLNLCLSEFLLSLIILSVGLDKHVVQSLFEHVSEVSLDVKF